MQNDKRFRFVQPNVLQERGSTGPDVGNRRKGLQTARVGRGGKGKKGPRKKNNLENSHTINRKIRLVHMTATAACGKTLAVKADAATRESAKPETKKSLLKKEKRNSTGRIKFTLTRRTLKLTVPALLRATAPEGGIAQTMKNLEKRIARSINIRPTATVG